MSNEYLRQSDLLALNTLSPEEDVEMRYAERLADRGGESPVSLQEEIRRAPNQKARDILLAEAAQRGGDYEQLQTPAPVKRRSNDWRAAIRESLGDGETPDGPSFDEMLKGFKPEAAAKPVDTSTWGNVKRGFIVATEQMPQLAYGLAAFGASGLETMLGEGGISSAAKNWAVGKYQDWGAKIQANSSENDEFTTAYDKAKSGDFGALVDWLSYGVGYTLSQGAQMLATGGVGSLVGKAALKGSAEKLASGMVAKEAATLAAGKEVTEEITKAAVANVSSRLGQMGAIGAAAYGMEGGEIGGDLASMSAKEGRALTGAELARGLGATVLAGSLEFVGDKLGYDTILGKNKFGMGGIKGWPGKVARGAAGAVTNMPAEFGTEYFQTGAENWGKGEEENILPFNQSEKAQMDALNSGALGAVGGAVHGVIGGAISRARNVDEAIDAANQSLAAPIDTTKLDRSINNLDAAVDAEVAARFSAPTLPTPTADTYNPAGSTLVATENGIVATPDQMQASAAQVEQQRLSGMVQDAPLPGMMARATEQADEIQKRASLAAEIEKIEQQRQERIASQAALNVEEGTLTQAEPIPVPAKMPKAPAGSRAAAAAAVQGEQVQSELAPAEAQSVKSMPGVMRSEANVANEARLQQVQDQETMLSPARTHSEAISAAAPHITDAKAILPDQMRDASQSTGTKATKQEGKLIKTVGKLFGKNVVFFTSSNASAADGLVRSSDNKTIYINANSGISPMAVFGHELAHQIRKETPHLWAPMARVIGNSLGSNGFEQAWRDYHNTDQKNIDAIDTALGDLSGNEREEALKKFLAETHEDGKRSRADFILEEATSDMTGNRFREPDFWREVFSEVAKEQGRSAVERLAMKIMAAVKRMINAISGRGFNVDEFVDPKQLDAIRSAIKTAVKDYHDYQRDTKGYGYSDTGYRVGGIKSDTDSDGGEAQYAAKREDFTNQTLPTRWPTSKKLDPAPSVHDDMITDIDTLRRDPAQYAKAVEAILEEPGMHSAGMADGTIDEKAAHVIKRMKDNLLWLYDQVPEAIRERSKLWYDGARKIAEAWAERYEISEAQAAGALAVLSPQKDWFMNVTMAERVLDIIHTKMNHRFDERMDAAAFSFLTKESVKEEPDAQKNLRAYEAVKGKTLKQVAAHHDLRQMSVWIRAYDEAYHDAKHAIVTPEGGFVEDKTTVGGDPTLRAWGDFTTPGKAASIYLDGTPENINKMLGGEHKVRNFYNNIFAPKDPRFTTIDTHAVAADMLRPLAGADKPVAENFGKTGGTNVTGLSGTYALHYEAYRHAAEARGVLPREMQSITWEAVRGLFTEGYKGKKDNVRYVDSIWNQVDDGKLTVEEARDQIVEHAGGIQNPDWWSEGNAEYKAVLRDKTYVQQRAPFAGSRMVFEVAPDPRNKELKGRWDALSASDKQEISHKVAWKIVAKALASFNDENMKGELHHQVGGFGADSNPSLSVWFNKRAAGTKIADLIRIVGYALNQQSMMRTSPRPFKTSTGAKAQQFGAIIVEIPTEFTGNQINSLYTELRTITGKRNKPFVSGHSTADGVMVILNNEAQSGISNEDLTQRIGDRLFGRHNVHLDTLYAEFPEKGKDSYGLRSKSQEAGGYSPEPSVRARADQLRAESGVLFEQLVSAAEKDTSFSPARFDGAGSAAGGELSRSVGEGSRPGAVSATGIHYSQEKRQFLDSSYFGRGLKAEELPRVSESTDERIKHRIYFYVNEGRGISPENGVGSHAHKYDLTNLYDLTADREDLFAKLWRNKNSMESAILDRGYDGWTGGGIAILLGKRSIAPEYVGQFTKPEVSEREYSEKSPFGKMQRAVMANNSLPGGEMTGADWKRLMPKLMPEVDVSHLEDEKRYYKDQIVKRPDATDQGGVSLSKVREQTETPEFKRWFGDWDHPKAFSSKFPADKTPPSMAMDWDANKPLVLFHATNADFDIFETGRESITSTTFGPVETRRHAIFTTPDVKFAESYLKKGVGQNVMPVYMDIKSPMDLRNNGAWDYVDELVANGFENHRWPNRSDTEMWEMFDDETGEAFVAAAKKAGYDGAIMYEVNDDDKMVEVYVAFDPTQIKSATGNNGQFDPTNPDIRMSRPRFYSQLERAVEGAPDKVFGPAKQVKAWLQSNSAKLGVKADEIQWTGITDWLDMQAGKVSKSDVLNYLQQNGVKVEEVVKGVSETKLTAKKASSYSQDELTQFPGYEGIEPTDWLMFNESGKWVGTYQGGANSESAAVEAYRKEAQDEGYDGVLTGGETKYGKYQLPGGENYRELLLTLPKKKATIKPDGEKFAVMLPDGRRFGSYSSLADAESALNRTDGQIGPNFQSQHWSDTKNVLAHIRFNDRTDADGNRVLFIEEIQSDWGQKGKKEGFVADGKLPSGWTVEQVKVSKYGDAMEWAVFDNSKTQVGLYGKTRDEAIKSALNPKGYTGGTPTAPFVTDTKSWVALAVKRMIAHAVENGYDKVAFVTGEQSADRYDLSKQISAIDSSKTTQGKYAIRAKDHSNNVVIDDVYSADKLEDVVGKELAKRIVDETPEGSVPGRAYAKTFSGLDLKVVGEGMKSFYDRIVPQVVNDVLKKVGGVRVESIRFNDFESKNGASDDKLLSDLGVEVSGTRPAGQPGFTITPTMREKVAGGQALFSTRRIIGDSGRQYTNAQKQMFKGVGREVNDLTVGEKLNELRKDLGKKLAQGIVDQFTPIKDITEKGYMLARLSKGATGAFEAFMHHGKLSLNGGAYDADTSGGVMEKVFYPLGKETTDFLYWIAGNRAERLAREGKENLFTPQDILAAKSLSGGTTDFDYTLRNGQVTRDRTKIYADALQNFNEFSRNVMDMAEQSGLIDKDSRHLWEHDFYVPFYRVMEDDAIGGANIGKGLIRQTAFKKLKGGTESLNDLLSNTLMNWAHLIDASAKNRAAKETLEAAAQVGAARPAVSGEKKTVWYMDAGQKQEFKVDDPYLLTAINGLTYAGLRGPMMDVLSKTKHWLTMGVTASPFFKIRNLIRDSVQAIATSDLGYNPVKNVVEGAKLTNRQRQEYVSALAGGGLIRFGTMLEGNEAARARQLIKIGASDDHILDSEGKVQRFYDKHLEPLVTAYNELGNRGEEINRMSLYDQLIKQGKSHAEASLLARDLMDFSMQGSWETIRFLTQVVPFMNARLQGLYKLGRAAKEDPAKMAVVLGGVTLASLALLALYGDDDDWKKREDWDRDNYWWFKVGGTAFRIPKPFEIGAIATLAERSAEFMFDNEMTGDRFRKVTSKLVLDQLAMNPVPQLVKPIIDLYANKDSFSGRPIETMGMEKLDPSYRFRQNTSMVARGISSAGNAVTGEHFLSPVQVDSAIRGYFSWLGAFVVGAADIAVRGASNEPTKPAVDYWKTATGGMVSDLDSASSRYVSSMYEQAKELEQAYGTYRSLIKEGKTAEATEYREDNKEKLSKYREVENVKRAEAKLNERIRMIERSNMQADEKRDLINQIRKQQDVVARRVAPGA